jgi:hypothetical protein
MTREQQRQIKAEKQAKKLADREARKQERIELRAWEKLVKRWKEKGAWIDEPEINLINQKISK